LKIYISQGTVATHLRCGGIFSNCIIVNFIQNVSVKGFWKSVNIWQRYGQWQSGTFFETQCRYNDKQVKHLTGDAHFLQTVLMSINTLTGQLYQFYPQQALNGHDEGHTTTHNPLDFVTLRSAPWNMAIR